MPGSEFIPSIDGPSSFQYTKLNKRLRLKHDKMC